MVLNEAVFVQYLDAGAWHLAFYNDGRERETVSFSTNVMGEKEGEFGVGGGGGRGGEAGWEVDEIKHQYAEGWEKIERGSY